MSRRWHEWIEPGMALAILAAVAAAMATLWTTGALPQPFFYEASDTWMDWFNTAYWAHDRGTYDAWGTIYPPLSFVFLKLAGLSRCYADAAVVGGTTSYSARECDWLGAVVLHALYVLDAVLVARVFVKLDRRTALPRAVAVAAGLPMLEALERGNLVLACFACFLLAHGPLLRSVRARWLALGLAINFKVYLVASLFPYLLRRRWLWFEGALLATVAVYLVTWGLLGRGNPRELVDNIVAFNAISSPTGFLDVWYAATYRATAALLEGDGFPIVAVLGSAHVDGALTLIHVSLRVTQGAIVLAAAAAWWRPGAVPMHRLVCLGTALALVTAESGGYTAVLVIFLALFERWEGIGRRVAITACYLLSIPADISLQPLVTTYRAGFLDGPAAPAVYWLTVGPFVRPALLLAIPLALALVTLRQVGREVWTALPDPAASAKDAR